MITNNIDNIEVNVNQNQTLRNINELWPPSEICENVLTLNADQTLIFDHILKHICTSEDQMFHFVTGGAGAGKSVLLNMLYQAMSRIYNLDAQNRPDLKAVIKMCPTGKAAYLIGGKTIHGTLGIKPANSYKIYKHLPADQLNTLFVQFMNTKVVLLDEVSMVGCNLFRFIDLRLQKITGKNAPFGGLHVICFGDLYQLPPVKDK